MSRDYSKCVHAHAHEHSDYTKLNLIQLKTGSRDLRWMRTAVWNRKHGRSIVLGKTKFLGCTCMSPEGVSVREEGEGYSM